MNKIYKNFYNGNVKLGLILQFIMIALETIENFRHHHTSLTHFYIFLFDIFMWFVLLPCIIFLLIYRKSDV